MSSPVVGQVPVHIGQPEPGSERERLLRQRQEHSRTRFDRERAPRVPDGLDWHKHGLQPRWLGMESSDCVIALEPGYVHDQGADERERFLAGALRRDEPAIVVSMIGYVDDDSPRRVLSIFDSSVQVSAQFTHVSGRRLPAGTRPEVAPDLSPADRDLALRLLTRPADAPWWSLELGGSRFERGDGSGSFDYAPEGQLHPILVDPLGKPVVAAWTPPAGDQRWYIIPNATDWDNVLGWLVHKALPELVPSALRRARSPHFVDPGLQTIDEARARRALDDLEAYYAEEKARLERDLGEAEARAEPVRYGLLYGTSSELVRAVATVLTAAGLDCVDLDEELGATKSADLLVSPGHPPRRLVEVKAVGGAAQEHLVSHLQRHLETWPQLRPHLPVAGGVLVVNHQHKLVPTERTTDVYSRPEFVASLPVTVLSTLKMVQWWRAGDWATIRTEVLGVELTSPVATVPPLVPATGPVTRTRSTWRWRPSGRTREREEP